MAGEIGSCFSKRNEKDLKDITQSKNGQGKDEQRNNDVKIE